MNRSAFLAQFPVATSSGEGSSRVSNAKGWFLAGFSVLAALLLVSGGALAQSGTERPYLQSGFSAEQKDILLRDLERLETIDSKLRDSRVMEAGARGGSAGSFSAYVRERIRFIYLETVNIPGISFPSTQPEPAPSPSSLASGAPSSPTHQNQNTVTFRARNESLLLVRNAILADSSTHPQILPIYHPHVGWVRIGQYYFEPYRGGRSGAQTNVQSGAVPAWPDTEVAAEVRTLSRTSVLVHEARHSDCPPEVFRRWVRNPTFRPGSTCGWIHAQCPPGLGLSGRLVCDDSPLGGYGLQAEWLRRIHQHCAACTVTERRAAMILLHDTLAHLTDRALNEFGMQGRLLLRAHQELSEVFRLRGGGSSSQHSLSDSCRISEAFFAASNR